MNSDRTLLEAKRLWDMGWAILWVHPRDKRPIGNAWTSGPRKSWKELRESYKPGNNVGVRTGAPSRIGDYFLGCLDLDVKDPTKKEELVAAYRRACVGKVLPEVRSGSGNGSRHGYFLSPEPFKQVTLFKESYGELIAYSEGRQMVLPPSIHPSGRSYVWKRPLKELPVLSFESVQLGPKKSDKTDLPGRFVFTKVDLEWLPISEEVRKGITTCEGVKDRSAYLMKASTALYSAGLDRDEVLSVLTDKRYALGETAFDHAKTNDRQRAAEWLLKFTTAKIEKERSSDIFKDVAVTKPRKLSKEEIEAQRDWQDKLVTTANGKGFKPCFMNALLILENKFGTSLFHKDDFSLRRTYGMDTPWGGKKGRELNDEDITAMRRYVCENYNFELEEKHVVPAITSISSRNHHHPVTEYLDSLVWDGVHRVDTWLKDFAGVDAEKEYVETISRKVLCAMVARAYRPGTKFDYVLILEGPNQGEGKSRSIRALATPEWAGTVRFDMDHKDFVLALQGRWITEISELSGLGRKNTAFVKAIVSEESDRIRHPYGRFTETLPRQGIFIGTTNHFHYLEDETGNRRFWPVRVGPKIDVEGLAKVRDQLFAEAKVLLEKGEKLYIEDTRIERLARDQQSSRMAEDSWEEKIVRFFLTQKDIPKNERFNTHKFKILDLFGKDGPLRESIDSEQNLRRVCRCLRRLNYYPRDMKGQKGHGKYWVKREEFPTKRRDKWGRNEKLDATGKPGSRVVAPSDATSFL